MKKCLLCNHSLKCENGGDSEYCEEHRTVKDEETAQTDGKIYYSWDDYNADIKEIVENIKKKEKVHLVSIYRGSLIMGTHLSNLLGLPLTIGKFQSYNDKNDKDFEVVFSPGIKEDEEIVILDDILDSGNTLNKAYGHFKSNYPNKVSSCTLFANKEHSRKLDNLEMRPHNGQWIYFPWEYV